jgi:formate dehydrogenase accessory protein FdhE
MVRTGQKQSAAREVSAAQWDRRIHRANELTSAFPFAEQGLRFYSRIAAFQRALYNEFQILSANQPKVRPDRLLRDELDGKVLLPKFSGFLARVGEIAPAPLAQSAQEIARAGSQSWERVLTEFWNSDMELSDENGEPGNPERLLAWIFLQPYAEHLAGRREQTTTDGTPLTCPLCGGRPIVGVLRREGDGARKSLICMLCAHEWAFRRLYCPACGEEREPQLAFYSSPQIAHVRVDVCDTCHTYLKSVDLTKAGLAEPVVDELAAIPLDLWAREHGYHKLQCNLLGM